MAKKTNHGKWIVRGPVSAAMPIHDVHINLFAHCADNLSASFKKSRFRVKQEPTTRDLERFYELEAYQLFTKAAYACGFVCCDLHPADVLSTVNGDPQKTLARMDLSSLRIYVHTLIRAERWNGGESSPLYEACASGAITMLASNLRRLQEMALD
jgi:hypothetical protein